MNWVKGTLAKHPKPATYPILNYRFDPAVQTEECELGTWNVPDVTLGSEVDEGDDSSEDDEGDVQLPAALMGL